MNPVKRLRELVVSVYLYNEWRGYEQLERELIPELERDPRFDANFVEGVRSHAADEKKHYRMFKGWFHERGEMPFAVGPSVGYFDTLVTWLVGMKSQETAADLVARPERFARLCRAVVTTERRGIRQLDGLLRQKFVRQDARLTRVLQTIRLDEPSHFLPYENWLKGNGYRGPSAREKVADWLVHYSIAALVVPFLYFNPRLKRLGAYAA